MTNTNLPIQWLVVESELDHLRTIEGGFSLARRGLITMPDGMHAFVKLGLHENTRQWAKKEIGVYRFLKRHRYTYAPELLSVNDDESGFAITARTSEDGWNWKENWTEARIDKTLEAMDALAALKPEGDDMKFFSEKAVDESHDGWKSVLGLAQLQTVLREKLRAIGKDDLADMLDFASEAKRSGQFVFQDDALVHNDVRADNCAWNAKTEEVCLVDWNWTQLGDRRIDLAATLTHVQKSGFDVLSKYANRLDSDALHWMAGFWFKAAATPIWKGGPEHLRDFQLLSGLTALELSARV